MSAMEPIYILYMTWYQSSIISIVPEAFIYSLKSDEKLTGLVQRFFEDRWGHLERCQLPNTKRSDWGVASIQITSEQITTGLNLTPTIDLISALDHQDGYVKWTYDLIFNPE
jgi:hypothetical protein